MNPDRNLSKDPSLKIEKDILEYSATDYKKRIENIVKNIKSKIKKPEKSEEENSFIKKFDYSLNIENSKVERKGKEIKINTSENIDIYEFINSMDFYNKSDIDKSKQFIQSSLELVVETERENDNGDSISMNKSVERKEKKLETISKFESSVNNPNSEEQTPKLSNTARKIPNRSKSIDLSSQNLIGSKPFSDQVYAVKSPGKSSYKFENCEFCQENFEILNECVVHKFLLALENQRLIQVYQETREENNFLSIQLSEILEFVEKNFNTKNLDFNSIEENRAEEVYKYNGGDDNDYEDELFRFHGPSRGSIKSDQNYGSWRKKSESKKIDIMENNEKFQEKFLIEKFLLSLEIERMEEMFKTRYDEICDRTNKLMEEVNKINDTLKQELSTSEQKIETLVEKIIEQRDHLANVLDELEIKSDLVEISKEKILTLEKDNTKLQKQISNILKTNSPRLSHKSPENDKNFSPSSQSYIEKMENEGLKKRIKILEKSLCDQTREKINLQLKLSKIKQKSSEVSFLQTPVRDKNLTESWHRNSTNTQNTQNSFFKSQRDDLMKVVESQWKEIKSLEKGKMDLIEKNINLSRLLSHKSEEKTENRLNHSERTMKNLKSWKRLETEVDNYLMEMEKGSVNLENEEGKLNESLVLKRDNRDSLRRVSSERKMDVNKV